MKHARLLWGFFVVAATCFGQGIPYQSNVFTSANSAPPGSQTPMLTVPFATVTICGATPIGNPCTNTVVIYSNASMSVTAHNPITADVHGRFNFWAPSGIYSYNVKSADGTNYGNFYLSLGGSGGGSTIALQHNGTAAPNQNVLNFDDTVPAAPSGNVNVVFQNDSSGKISAYVPIGGSTFTLTTTGSGPATYTSGVLNIPDYTYTLTVPKITALGTLTNDTSGSAAKWGGISISGTPGIGQVPVATSTTTASWQTVSTGAGGISGQTPNCVLKANSATTSSSSAALCELAGVLTATEPLTVSDGSGNAGMVALKQGTAGGTATNSIGLEAPASVTAYNVKLPGAQGTGALTNDGGGNLSWSAAGASTSNPSTCTSNSTGNKCLGVSPYLAVSGNWTTAIQAAVNDLGTEGGGTLWLPDNVDTANGALQDPTGANAVLQMPKVNYGTGLSIPITISGFTHTVGGPNTNGGAVLLNTTGTIGNFIGGYNAASTTFGPFTNVALKLAHLTIRTAGNTSMVAVNGNWISGVQLEDVRFDTVSGATPTSSSNAALILPSLSSDVAIRTVDTQCAGYYTCYVAGEHATLTNPDATNCVNCFVIDSRGAVNWGNGVVLIHPWIFQGVHAITSGTIATTVQVIDADFENNSAEDVYDPGNLLQGDINCNVPYDVGSTASRFTCSYSGAAHVRIHNLQYPRVAMDDKTGGLNFYTNSFTPDATLTHPGSGQLTYTLTGGPTTTATASGWNMTGSYSGGLQFGVQNTANTTSSYAALTLATTAGSGVLAALDTNETFGGVHFPSSIYFGSGALTGGFTIATEVAAPIRLGTNNTLAFTLDGTTQAATFAGTANAPIVNATTGFRIGGAAPSGHCPLGNGTNYVDGTCAQTVINGTSALGTSAIASGACATAVTTSATGTTTTDVIAWGFNADPTAVTGYVPSTSGMLTIISYPTANNVNFRVCNNTASSITPGAITLNWRVGR